MILRPKERLALPTSRSASRLSSARIRPEPQSSKEASDAHSRQIDIDAPVGAMTCEYRSSIQPVISAVVTAKLMQEKHRLSPRRLYGSLSGDGRYQINICGTSDFLNNCSMESFSSFNRQAIVLTQMFPASAK